MLKNYLKIAFRNIWKNKAFSLINIIGLSIGLSSAFVIGAMIYFDMTFDKFHSDGDRIYRVTTAFSSPQGEFYNPGVPVPLAQALKEKVTGVKTVSPIYTNAPYRVENRATEKVFRDSKNAIYTSDAYFQLFRYDWLAGDAKSALSRPNEVVLTKNRAEIYFPNLSANEVIGKTLIYNDTLSISVAGVVRNFEKRSDLVFEEFISVKTLGKEGLKNNLGDDGWNSTNSSSQLFVKLDEKADKTSIKEQLAAVVKEHEDGEMVAFGQTREFYLQPLTDIHFNPKYGTFDYSRDQASKSVLMSLAFVALFLLLLGCINFINLNTAQATQRAKEIGIRKTLGSSRKQLIYQFLGETLILTLTAATISLFLSSWLLRLFVDFMPKGVDFELFKNPALIFGTLVLLLVLTLLSGFYPALVLSRFKPVSVLKNQILPNRDKGSLRKYLTVFQFTIAQIFIIATLLVGKQIHFLMTKDMGFKTDVIAYVRTPYNDRSMDKKLRFMNEVKAIPHIKETTLGGNPPASRSWNSMGVAYKDGEKEVRSDLQLLFGDSDYLKLYKLKLLAGRMPLNDTIREYVINRTFMRQLGFKTPQEAVGKILGEGKDAYPIVGVIEDFYQRSLRTGIEPMALVGDWNRNEYAQFNTLHLSFDTDSSGQWTQNIAKVEAAWDKVYPDFDFDPKFMDDTIERFYEQESKTAVLLKWATGLAILISCLGLLGLVIHTTERRTREIGIRKVLGASLAQLNLLLCKEFLILVGIAFIIAAPIAWYGLNNWLQDFAYKTELSWWVFVVSGVAMLVISLIIMSIRTIAKANANPVKSLRTE
ncbi:ABC transporter permease [Maribacter halichondriae]|uniref:ABC transporter permease n=1 Tax=Maribacter halichondriae TaxID=2980554 RepID=UPI002358B257|nr:FtsX-like permease family protein [Maribacter sp. Hal144]